MAITDNLLNRIDSYLKANLSENRYRHCLSTAETAKQLCGIFSLDSEKGYLAGLLHDIARELDVAELTSLSLKDGNGIRESEKKHPLLLHGRAGSEMIKELFGITDREILDAVSSHTTGNKGMSSLAKIIFIADYIEPYRSHITDEYLSNLKGKSLDSMLKIVLNSILEYVREQSMMVSEISLELLKELENERKE
ncbi:MAG: bis(5'-nucleosyl)-tetraphosphatase (symmetrical) YqeK [Spirochaetia bacterium]|jgi:nicotinate-nucleotide adenylyltransferase|nr:bis(5'-nucleosyl)-tetraphosphatase (symmetrical) YqeK [Spirochaetia bacterium]